MWHLVDAVVSAFLSQRSVSCNVGILQPVSCLFLLHQAISYHDLTLFSYLSLQNELLAGGVAGGYADQWSIRSVVLLAIAVAWHDCEH